MLYGVEKVKKKKQANKQSKKQKQKQNRYWTRISYCKITDLYDHIR